jgi:hypothetical protein
MAIRPSYSVYKTMKFLSYGGHGINKFRLLSTLRYSYCNTLQHIYLGAQYSNFLLNNKQKFSAYLTANTLRHRYKAQPVNAV